MPPRSGNLVWMDLEMTGLDPDRDTIMEVATIVTDGELQVLAEGPVYAIHHTKHQLDSMDTWCIDHHGASGLSKRCLESSTTLEEAEKGTLGFIRKHCPERAAPLCGNSIHQDRRFIARYMPLLNDYLHYRIVDVSSVKELVQRWYPAEFTVFPKKKSHLALDDVRESILELAEYRRTFFRAPKPV
ncbi:MAG: oligoribonuclease [Elusimicrobia bacterium]|nr:oligoribonuclease [Elusimicrobiota bacterium]